MRIKSIIYSSLFLFLIFACQSQDLEKEASKKEKEEEEAFHKDIPLSESTLKEINDPKLKDLKKKLTRYNFEDSTRVLYDSLGLFDLGLDYKVFRYAFIGFLNLKREEKISEKNLLSIIDFTQSSCNKRFYTVDLDDREVIFNTYVSHGQRTGADMAKKFSDIPGSFQSSIGFYVTAETYVGSKGYSLRLEGTEKGYNENMRRRAVVMHDADYVSEEFIKTYGRLGRSQGCPALPKEISKEVIDTIKDQTAIFAYYNDQKYIKASNYLNLQKLMDNWEEEG
ncbi:MAG: murein L,D-transpeptidase catalytic domain family protein [Candidatus Cyclobacteriaceae bacterium M2_1C_046]